MKNRLIVAMMVQDEEVPIRLALNSVLEFADGVVIVDGGSKDNTIDVIEEYRLKNPNQIILYRSDFRKDYIGADGFQRQVYLNYLKRHFMGDWCLVLDADECVDDVKKLKEWLLTYQGDTDVFHIKMRHLFYNMAYEDHSVEEHYALGRLFRIKDNLFYPEIEHSVLTSDINEKTEKLDTITIWHFGDARNCFLWKQKWENNKKKSKIHNEQYLKWWYASRMFMGYPVKKVKYGDIPIPIKEFFHLSEVEDINLEFKGPNAETKNIRTEQTAKSS